MGNGCGKHGAMNSIYWKIVQYMRVWALLFPLQTDLIFQLHHIVATLVQDIVQDIESPQKQRLTSKKSAQHKTCSTVRQQKDTNDANKIIKYLDSEIPFDVTLSLCIIMILVLLPINQGLLTCRTVRTKNPWQHDSSQGSRPYDQEELPRCDKVHQATSDTVIIDPLLLFQHPITVSADMLKYKL